MKDARSWIQRSWFVPLMLLLLAACTTMTATNNAPTADDQSVTTNEDTPVTITLSGSDPDGDALTYTVATNPGNGTLSGTAPDLTYTPNPDFNGNDSFTFTVNDGTTDSPAATVSITVDAVNDPPTADDQSVTTNEDTPVTITLSGSDPDGDALTYTVATNPGNGTLSGTAPDLTYTPNPGYNGNDSFTFTVNDGTTDSPAATVSITVGAVNDPPTGIALSNASVAENQPSGTVVGTLSATDPEGDALSWSLVAGNGDADNASFTISGDQLETAASFDFETKASYSVRIQADDGNGGTAAKAFTITITDVNEAPSVTITAPTDGASFTTADAITLSGTATDPEDGDLASSLDWTSDRDGALGSGASVMVSLSEGSHTLTASVTDSGSLGDMASISVTVTRSLAPKWSRQLGTALTDEAFGVATDGSGNAFVVGRTNDSLDGNTSAGLHDLFVIKYDSSGTKQWSRQLGTVTGDEAHAVATDAGGNVYVVGFTGAGLDGNTSAGVNDLFVIKYDGSGSKQWSRQLGTALTDEAYGVATDASGNVYVVGWTAGGLDGNASAGSRDAFVVKYDSSGTKQWTTQFGTSGWDEARAVATDAGGNIYVAGFTFGDLAGTNAGLEDLFVVKIDSTGTILWSRQLGTSATDQAFGVTTDASGNVYAAGWTNGGLDGNTSAGAADGFLAKYDSSGTKLWTTQFGTTANDVANAVAGNGNGNFYVAGYSAGDLAATNAGGNDAVLVNIDSSGAVVWSRQFGTSGGDEANGVATGGLDDIFLAGFTSGDLDGTNAGDNDLFLSAY